ncbi:MAG: hypothetical protein NTW56_00870 [Alphaproteobacteria bacterium]|nr:hypothetical protein [Alphaproteobacteria bacterium]
MRALLTLAPLAGLLALLALAFHALADAMAAHRRLTRGGGR